MDNRWYIIRVILFGGCNKWYNGYNTDKKLFKHRYGQDWAKCRVLQLDCTLSSRSAPCTSKSLLSAGNCGRSRWRLRWPCMNRRSWRCSWPRWPFIVDMTTNTVIFRNNCWKKKSNVNWIQLQKYKLHIMYISVISVISVLLYKCNNVYNGNAFSLKMECVIRVL